MLRFVYSAADLIISRSGAGSIFEIAAAGKPSILIPLPEAAQDHQRKNAYEYAKTGAAIVIEENNLMPNLFEEKLHEILDHKGIYDGMAQQAILFAKPNAAYATAAEIIKLI